MKTRSLSSLQRLLAGRAARVIAAVVIAAGAAAWNTWIAPGSSQDTAAQETVAQDAPATATTTAATATPATGNSDIAALFAARRSNEMVSLTAPVTRVLPDDNKGSRHQRFLLAAGDGITVLVAHNIDLAPRVEGLAAGDTVSVRGEYEWTDKGGVIHWTHHDPAGRHQGGWIEHAGRRHE